jgi:thiamine-phosphate pyrophosphorylase
VTGLPTPCVCLVTDGRRLGGSSASGPDRVRRLGEWLRDAIGVVDLIQIREPDLDAVHLFGLAVQLVALASGSSTKILVNSRADVARAAGADGVHLRGDGLPVGTVRRFAPERWLIGRSAHTVAEVLGASDADYVTFGTIFSTTSKQDLLTFHGVEGLHAAAQASSRPILAIGGMTPERAALCRQAGAAGIAAIGAFLPPGSAPGALGIAAAADAFRRAMLVV